MVKLAQHIEWPSQLPSQAGEGTSSERPHTQAKKEADQVSNGKPRRTLAELFESRASSSSSSSFLTPTTTFSSTTTFSTSTATTISSSSSTIATALPSSSSTATTISSSSSLIATSLPSSSSSSSTTATATATYKTTAATQLPSSARSSSACSSSSSSSTSSSSAHAHVTFQEKVSATNHKHRSSELSGGIKRSSSARKIADSSRHEGIHIHPSHPSSKRISKSGPLEPLHRNPLTNAASDSEPSRWLSPAKPSNAHSNGKSNEKPSRNLTTVQQEKRTVATNLIAVEQRNRSLFAKFGTHEHNKKSLLLKSIDSVGILRNETDEIVGKRSDDAEYTDRVQAVQGTPTKGKKLRKGLFTLLTDSGSTKHSTADARASESVESRVSGNLGKATKHSGGDARGSLNLQSRLLGNVGISTKLVGGEMRNYQSLGNRMSGNLHKVEEGTESKSLVVEVPDKMVGLAWIGVEPRLLPPGSYSFPLEGFMLEQVVSERSSYVKHGMLHRVRIREGHLGVAWVNGKAELLEAGVSVHVCPSNRFSYITTDDKMVLEKEFVLGPFRVVTVDDSEVGIKFCNRQPQILYSGRHCLSISKVEVFAGFESLLRRQSNVSEASAMSSDSMKVSADVWVEWQIKAEDAAAARLANITDVEGALCSNVRRAFNLVIWEVNAHDMKLQLTGGVYSTCNTDSHPLLTTLSSNIRRECQDLFEEGWTVTIWDLQLKELLILPEVKDSHG